MNRFSYYLRDLINWYVWKIKIQKLNKDYNIFNYTVSYNGNFAWMSCIYLYNCRNLESYRQFDSLSRDSSYVAIKHNIRKLTVWKSYIRVKNVGVILPIRYRYSSGYEHPTAYKEIDTAEFKNDR